MTDFERRFKNFVYNDVYNSLVNELRNDVLSDFFNETELTTDLKNALCIFYFRGVKHGFQLNNMLSSSCSLEDDYDFFSI